MKIDLVNKKLGRKTIHETEHSHYVFFRKKSEIRPFFDKLIESTNCVKTNFGGNPLEWAAFVELKKDDTTIIVCSPRAKNGDTSWNHSCYDDGFGFYANVKIFRRKSK